MFALRHRLAAAGVISVTAIALPAAALASGSSPSSKPAPPHVSASSSGKHAVPAPDVSKSAQPVMKRPDPAGVAAEQAAMVRAFAARLGVGDSAAQRALNQIGALNMDGIDPSSPGFAAIAHGLGVSPTQLFNALRAAKQGLASK